MPNNPQMPPVYLRSGSPETENEPVLLYGGQLGMQFTIIEPIRSPAGVEDGRSKSYQIVRTDSTMSVAPYDSAVAWWSDKTRYMVTTSPTTLGRGRIAGVFKNNVTPGNYTCVQWLGPSRVKVVDAPTSPVVANSGQFVIPSATAGKADVLAAGTAATYPALGVVSGAFNGGDNTAIVDLNVPETS